MEIPYLHHLIIKRLLLNIRKVSLAALLSKLRKSCFGMLGGFSLSLLKLSTQISMASSKGILVNKESRSRLACVSWNPVDKFLQKSEMNQ